jgi:hypothetical protein
MADMRAAHDTYHPTISSAYSAICIGLGQKAMPSYHRFWLGTISVTERGSQRSRQSGHDRSRKQEKSRDAPEPMAAVGSPFGSLTRTNMRHVSGATVLPGERIPTKAASDMSDCSQAVTHSSGKVFE